MAKTGRPELSQEQKREQCGHSGRRRALRLSVTQRDIGVILLAGAFVLASGLALPRFWRGQVKDVMDRGTAGWWPLGEALRKDFLRSGLVAWLELVSGFLVLVGDAIRHNSVSRLHDLADAGVTISALLFPLCLLLLATVHLFNWPKFFVPPVHRDEPGAVRYWFEAWRRGGDPSGPILPRSRRRHTYALGYFGAMLIGLAFVLLITYAGYFGRYGGGEPPWLGWAIVLLLIGVAAVVVFYRRTKRSNKGGKGRS